MSKIFASNHIYQQRLTTCRTCEEYGQTLKICKACGCFMPAKAKIANIRCPKDKWKEVYGTEDKEPTTFTMTRVTGEKSKQERSDELFRQADHLKSEYEKLILEAKKLNGTD